MTPTSVIALRRRSHEITTATLASLFFFNQLDTNRFYGITDLMNSIISLLLIGFSEMASPFLWNNTYPSLANSSMQALTLLPLFFTCLLSQLTTELKGRYLAPQQLFLRSLFIMSALISVLLISRLTMVHLPYLQKGNI